MNSRASLLVFFFTAALLGSCQSEPDKKYDAVVAEDQTLDNTVNPLKTLVLPYTAVINDTTHRMELRRDPAADMSNLTGSDLVEAMNVKYPEVPVTWLRTSGTTAYVTIKDATYLTQEAGSEGAQAFLAELTYALTELPEVKAVDIRFTSGDHAQSGLYTRASFRGM